jgi:hypothetical protein
MGQHIVMNVTGSSYDTYPRKSLKRENSIYLFDYTRSERQIDRENQTVCREKMRKRRWKSRYTTRVGITSTLFASQPHSTSLLNIKQQTKQSTKPNQTAYDACMLCIVGEYLGRKLFLALNPLPLSSPLAQFTVRPIVLLYPYLFVCRPLYLFLHFTKYLNL